MSDMTVSGFVATASLAFDRHQTCDAAGENYALGTASTMARASEKTNICQQSAAMRLLVGG